MLPENAEIRKIKASKRQKKKNELKKYKFVYRDTRISANMNKKKVANHPKGGSSLEPSFD